MTLTKSLYSPRLVLGYVATVASITALVRVGGFVEKVVAAAFFGTRHDYDAYLMAVNFVMIAFFAASSLVKPVLGPLFVRKNQEEQWDEVSSHLLSWTILFAALTAAFGLIVFLCADTVIHTLAPGFAPSTHALCVDLLRLMLPCAVVFSLLPLSNCVMTARRLFVIPPLTDLAMKMTLLGVIVLLAHPLGAKALAVGTIASLFMALLFHSFTIGRLWSRPRLKLVFASEEFRRSLLLMTAPILGTIFAQAGGLVENAACSNLGEGVVSALSFARKLTNLPLLVISVACSTVLFTFFAELNSQHDHSSMAGLLGRGIRGMLFLFLPMVLMMVILAEPIVALVYQRGMFDAESTRLVALILFWLAPGMCFDVIEQLLMQHFFSREDLWPPFLIGSFCVLAKIALIISCVQYFGIVAIPAAIVLARGLKVIALGWSVYRRGKVTVRQLELRELLRLVPATLFAGIAGTASVTEALPVLGTGGFITRLGTICFGGMVILMTYLIVAHLFGVRECRFLAAYLRARFV